MKEREWIRKYIVPLVTSPGAAGLEDDVAELRTEGPLIITTDMLVEGRHFLAEDPIRTVGQKIVRVNVSDLLSKGAEPVEAVLSIAWPEHRPESDFTRLMEGIQADLNAFGLALVGGDLVATDGPLVLNLAATGRCLGRGVVRRSGAQVGDAVYVSGPLGYGVLGLAAAKRGEKGDLSQRYRVPQIPPLDLAGVIAAEATSSMDVSDGLLLDASRIALASGVGIHLDLDRIPLAEPTDQIEHILRQCTGGDDYQILLTAPRDGHMAGFHSIGEVRHGTGLSLAMRGQPVDLPEVQGFEH